MPADLSIIPFVRTALFAALLAATTGCYEMDEFYAPSTDEQAETDTDDEAATDEDGADEVDDEGAGDEHTVGGDAAPGDELEDGEAPAEDAEVAPEDCAFGMHTSEMGDVEDLDVDDFEHLFGAESLTDLEVDQLLGGLDLYPWIDAPDLDGVFAEIDDQRILIRKLERVSTGQVFVHVRFYVREMEHGFVFFGGSLRLVAAIDGGSIVGCTVPLS